MEQILIVGHVGKDATIHSGNGSEYVRFSVGVSQKFKDGQGNETSRTNWYSVFSTQKSLAQYLVKGQQVLVQGRLSAQIDKNPNTGVNQINFQVNDPRIQLLGKKEEMQSTAATATPAPVPQSFEAQGQMPSLAPQNGGNPDDLPF